MMLKSGRACYTQLIWLVSLFVVAFGVGWFIHYGRPFLNSASGPPTALAATPRRAALCGANAAVFVLRWHGVDTTFQECLSAMRTTEHGVGMNDWIALMRSFGLETEVLQIDSVNDLSGSSDPHLLFLNERTEHSIHAAVVLCRDASFESRRFVFVEPPNQLRVSSAEEIDAISAGLAIRVGAKLNEVACNSD